MSSIPESWMSQFSLASFEKGRKGGALVFTVGWRARVR